MHANIRIEPVPAATVVLVREEAGELQVYLLRRSRQSDFMGGFYVFPGGAVGPEDQEAEFWQHHSKSDDFTRITRGQLTAAEALAFMVAAIRETFEEAGVMLAGNFQTGRSETGITDIRFRAGGLKAGWLKTFLQAQDRSLSFSGLLPWSHWITPVLMSRRFDTRFFIVKMPKGQVCRPDNTETTHGIWINPRNGLQENMDGRIPLSPPTLVTLHGLLGYASFEQVEAVAMARGWGRTTLPRLVPLEDSAVIVEPWDPAYADSRIEIDPDALPESVQEVGAPFSRLWLKDGFWKPVQDRLQPD